LGIAIYPAFRKLATFMNKLRLPAALGKVFGIGKVALDPLGFSGVASLAQCISGAA
jgi:hypothetical protein